MSNRNEFSDTLSYINQEQFYATQAVMIKNGSSKPASTQDALALESMAKLNNTTSMEILYSRLNRDQSKNMYQRGIYTDMNLFRQPSEQIDVFTTTKNANSIQSRNILP